MILLEGPSRVLQQILHNRLLTMEKPVEIDFHLVEFDDIRFHVQGSAKDPQHILLSIAIPPPPPETVFYGGLPFGALEAVKAAYGNLVEVIELPESGYHLSIQINLTKLPATEAVRVQQITKVASLRTVVLGAPLRVILKHLGTRSVAPDADNLVALMHRPEQSYFLIPQPEKVTVVFPMRYKDANDVVLATSFLQEFMEARRSAGLSTAPPCLWAPTPPLELKGAPAHALDANSGFVSFVIFPRHVEGEKLDSIVWNLSTFYAYVSYHIKCSKAFMHTRMRRRVNTLIQALEKAKLEVEKQKKTAQGRSFKRQV
jgi:actin related protein 2/3 complex subunit 2